MTKHAKAASLFALGYRAALRGPNILIRNPEGVVYCIDPNRETCSCPWQGGECSHLLGFRDLMLDTANALSVAAHERIVCVRGCWNYDETGRRLASRACALSDRAFDVLLMGEGRVERERLLAA